MRIQKKSIRHESIIFIEVRKIEKNTSSIGNIFGTDFEKQAELECLESLYRNTPDSILSHVIAAAFVVFALHPVVERERLFLWLGVVLAVGTFRYFMNAACLKRWPLDAPQLETWRVRLSGLTLMQTLCWGSAAVFLWPEEMGYRAVLVVSLARVVAAGGIVLAVHRNSFLIYCFPIVIPTVIQLLLSGGRLEFVLAALMVLYSIVLIVAVTRLGNNFIEGLVLRLKMQALSRTDSLTSLSNRRGFDEYLGDTWQNSKRSSQSIGLIVADIDFFKAFNDFYGHPEGDEALKKVAEVLHQVASRGTDLCARVGGEEFAIVLPSTDIEGTLQVAHDIQSMLAQENIAHEKSPYERLTLSMGIYAKVPTAAAVLEDFYSDADKALYKAKRGGRNSVELVVADLE